MTTTKPRVIARNRKEFAEVRDRELACVVVSQDNDWREVPRSPESAWSLLDGDPKARLLDLGGGAYKVERRPQPLWYLLWLVPAEADSPCDHGDPQPLVIERDDERFFDLKRRAYARALDCVLVNPFSDNREATQPALSALSWLDKDTKATLLDLCDGTYRVERRLWPLHYVLRPKSSEAAS
ncbi:hypothetical protein [Parafrankia sp. FMc2]|uniref:hypothetical protein n=1 Tax=Parafrankia sp. FMc2 TaxID=3233196 RepID=UPI0034D68824